MQRGSTTAAVAAMDAAGAVPAAIVGLLLLNDKIWPGREWLAAVGFLVTLAAVIGLTRYAEPQHHHAVGPGTAVGDGRRRWSVPAGRGSTGPAHRRRRARPVGVAATTGRRRLDRPSTGRRRPTTRS